GLEHQGRQALELASPSKVWEKMDQKTLLKVGGCAAATAAGLAIPPLLISSLGFGAGGVVAGSYAAWTNSVMPCVVVKGGLFATMQSWGAAGIPLASKLLMATCSGAAGLGTTTLLTKDKDPDFIRRPWVSEDQPACTAVHCNSLSRDPPRSAPAPLVAIHSAPARHHPPPAFELAQPMFLTGRVHDVFEPTLRRAKLDVHLWLICRSRSRRLVRQHGAAHFGGGAGRVVALGLLGLGFHWRGRTLRLSLNHHVVDVVFVNSSSHGSGVGADTVVTLVVIGTALGAPGGLAVLTAFPVLRHRKHTGALPGTTTNAKPPPKRS
ncbi:hypothetical protein HPB47_003630, partial [Ixodes persulcatus]